MAETRNLAAISLHRASRMGRSVLRLHRYKKLSNDETRQRNSMRRRQLIVLIISGIVTRPFAVMARQQTYRLGCLLALARDAPENIAFFEELRRRGFVEGQNLTVEYRAYALRLDLISQYAAELEHVPPELTR